jgi:hypothetical protein
LTDKAPEFLTGAFVGEGSIETLKLDPAASAVAKGDPVKLNGDLQVTNHAANDKVVGIALKAAAAGSLNLPVCTRGKLKLTAGGAIAAGAAIKGGGGSVVVAAVSTVTIPTGATAVTSTSAQPTITVEAGIALGVALQAAAANGDTILCLVNAV